MKSLSIGLLCCLLVSGISKASELQLDSLRLTSARQFSFTVKWSNSWSLPDSIAPGNHDAVWLFGKYRYPAQEWKPLLWPQDTARYEGTKENGLRALPSPDRLGCWLQRRDRVASSVPITISLNEAFPDTAQLELRLYALEMVYIPPGPFQVGDGRSFFHLGDNGNAPFAIRDSGAIDVGAQPGQLYSDTDYFPSGKVPAAYPEGFRGVYAMKYELSQSQYADFLNTCSPAQQQRRMQADPGAKIGTAAFRDANRHRNGLVIVRPADGMKPARIGIDANEDGRYGDAQDGVHRAMNYLNWADLAAYLDWAGLRPMSELEFEKICRGPQRPVPGELAFGTAQVVDANEVIFNGSPRESVREVLPEGHGLASHGYTGPEGPLRTGFAASDTSRRLEAGAAFYGPMEMSGNVWELVVNLNAEGLRFDGRHGDGQLDPNGDADVARWPGADGDGAGHRGGAWSSGVVGPYRDVAISDRYYIYLKPDQRRNTTGGRGVRTAPFPDTPRDTLSFRQSSPDPFRGDRGGGYQQAVWRGSALTGEADPALTEIPVYFDQEHHMLHLRETASAQGGQVSVHALDGRRIWSRTVHPGETAVRLSRNRTASGAYVLSWLSRDGHHRWSRIISF